VTNRRFVFPALPGLAQSPEWTGNGFLVGDKALPLLSYEGKSSGWTDELTEFHENVAGSSHFIDVASRQIAIREAALHCPKPGEAVMLDIGCSSGFLLADMRAAFPDAFVLGADVVLRPLAALAKRLPGVPLMHFDLTRCPLPDASVDVVFLLNVLEHIEDHAEAVRQLHRILKPGGLAVVEVPAGPELYDVYDKLLMHHRRYRQRELLKLFTDARFEPLRQSHLGCFVYPGFYAVKRLRKRKTQLSPEEMEALVREDIGGTAGNPLLGALTRLEVWMGKAISYPFGIRCLLTARKQ
jgi:SAM-dependent methyltransferase